MGSDSRELARYPAVPFHIIRAVAYISSTVVSGILFYFAFILRRDGFKIPWTVLVILGSSTITLLTLVLTSLLHACSTLTPFFSLLLNIPFLLWHLISFSLLTYNIYGTLGHSCTLANWGNSTGVTVCNVYKLLYSFLLFAVLAQIALIVLDFRVRKAQKQSGSYDRMMDDSSAAKGLQLDRLNPLGSRRTTPRVEQDATAAAAASLSRSQSSSIQSQQQPPPPSQRFEPYWTEERHLQGPGSAYGADAAASSITPYSSRGGSPVHSTAPPAYGYGEGGGAGGGGAASNGQRSPRRHRHHRQQEHRPQYNESSTSYSRGGSPYGNNSNHGYGYNSAGPPVRDFTYRGRDQSESAGGYDASSRYGTRY